VDPSHRGEGLGIALTRRLLEDAQRAGLRRVFLLTETAQAFFPRFGFRPVARDDADPAVRGSVEFASACPASAQCMALDLAAIRPAPVAGNAWIARESSSTPSTDSSRIAPMTGSSPHALARTPARPIPDQEVRRIFEAVRDIPFGFGPHQDPASLLTCGYGTCAPKHALLAQRFAALGLRTRFVYVTFRFDDMPGNFPPDLASLVHDGKLRGHVALQLERDGRWLDVDATFDAPLARSGFTVTLDWDGRRSMPLTVVPVHREESLDEPARFEPLQSIHRETALPGSLVRRINAWLEEQRQGV
jgi:transglutaminase-like putative cysteine protease